MGKYIFFNADRRKVARKPPRSNQFKYIVLGLTGSHTNFEFSKIFLTDYRPASREIFSNDGLHRNLILEKRKKLDWFPKAICSSFLSARDVQVSHICDMMFACIL